ncbi:60S ribosomal protein L10-1-like [Pyrus ussuriensis x Pyrus communis]|uniref:60S ribosomal protein L10-1-like n=1 Tax=Pyrus ussuriensis x Pyrus communis TaxID=2448454 RepID=A0A5N5I2P3_9ROSA|nr:60S ribosomal protein L10-1-like [Pyrus ussuriensis x Pyrus communis]
MALFAFLAVNREQHLPNSNPSASPERLPESSAHTSGTYPFRRTWSCTCCRDSRRLESLAGNFPSPRRRARVRSSEKSQRKRGKAMEKKQSKPIELLNTMVSGD